MMSFWMIDFGAERDRIRKEIAKVDKDIAFFEKKLGNPKFVANAPDHVVAKDREKLDAARDKRGLLESGLSRLANA